MLLVLVNSVGYLPYSDRPGPGWQLSHLPTLAEVQFFAGFALLLAAGTAIYGFALAGMGWALEFCSLPRWVVGVFAAPIAFMTSGLMMADGGWLIALSPVGVYTAVEVIRRDDAGSTLSVADLSHVGPSIAQKIKGSGKYVSVSRLDFMTDGRNESHVLLIIDDPMAVTHTFLLPRAGDAIYPQREGKWNEELTEARQICSHWARAEFEFRVMRK